MNKLVDDIIQLYCEFDSTDLSTLGAIYHPNIVFIDPAHRLEGLEHLVAYFKSTMQGTTQCSFSFGSPNVQGTRAVLEWQMHYSHPKLNGGEKLVLDGVSILQAELHAGADDLRIVYQRDYYDLGAMLYEHVPLLGRVVGAVKKRIAAY